MAQPVAQADRGAVRAIVEKHCATWPVQAQRCAAATTADDHRAQERCFGDVPLRDRATMKSELADATIDCGILDSLAIDHPTWFAAPAGTAVADWVTVDITISSLAENRCRATLWSRDVLRCLRHQRGSDANPRDCLPGPERVALDATLAHVVDLWTRAGAGKPPTCAEVANAWYSDAAWKAHHASGSAKAARANLVANCDAYAGSYPAIVRTCMMLAKTDRERIYCTGSNSLNDGFPPIVIDPKRPSCPLADATELRGLLCDDLPPNAWDLAVDALRRKYEAAASHPPDCTVEIDEVVARYKTLGCKL